MNCDACKEQVLDLIERETIDPQSVAEILARCPDCRVEFDKLKAVLAAVSELPVEEPPAAVDAAILRAAAARSREPVALRKRRLQAPPWAMAAIALLAVGVGVWSIPREVDTDGEASVIDAKDSADLLVADAALDEKEGVAEQVGGRQPAAAARTAAAPAVTDAAPTAEAAVRGAAPRERPSVAAKKAVTQPPSSRRRQETLADELEASNLAEATPAESKAASAGGSSTAAMADDDSEACRRMVAELERRQREDAAHTLEAEEALSLGLCHQTLGQTEEARRWLLRAAAEPQTKVRARKALEALEAE